MASQWGDSCRAELDRASRATAPSRDQELTGVYSPTFLCAVLCRVGCSHGASAALARINCIFPLPFSHSPILPFSPQFSLLSSSSLIPLLREYAQPQSRPSLPTEQ